MIQPKSERAGIMGTAPRDVTAAVIGTGQIGTFAAAELGDCGCLVALADLSPEPTFVRRYARSDAVVDSLDMCNQGAVDSFLSANPTIRTVVVAAGLTGERALADVAGMRRLAIDGIPGVVERAAVSGCARVILVSSLAVYGWDGVAVSLAEDEAPVRPQSEYGAVLAEMEEAVRGLQAPVEVVFLRIAGVYGPNRFGYGSHSSRFVEQLVYSAACGHEVEIVGRLDDCDDYVYVRDVGRAVAAAVQAPAGALPEIINVGTGAVTTLADVADALKVTFPDFRYRVTPPVDDRKPFYRRPLNADRLVAILGMRPAPFSTGLEAFVRDADLNTGSSRHLQESG